jgi:hypothetical protein
MDPLSPQDPVGKLLGHARPVEPRPNFTQNVLRAVRLLPQRLSLRERLAEWCASLSRPALAGACGVAIAGLLAFQSLRQSDTSKVILSLSQDNTSIAVAQATGAVGDSDVVTTLDTMDQLSSLLAQTDARAMTDTEVAFLLY